jgi:hypothetical protein
MGGGYKDPFPEDFQPEAHGIDSPIRKPKHANTMINSCMFTRKLDMILAGGSGSNEVRAFDIKTGEIIA